jgi:hypothetical protein
VEERVHGIAVTFASGTPPSTPGHSVRRRQSQRSDAILILILILSGMRLIN